MTEMKVRLLRRDVLEILVGRLRFAMYPLQFSVVCSALWKQPWMSGSILARLTTILHLAVITLMWAGGCNALSLLRLPLSIEPPQRVGGFLRLCQSTPSASPYRVDRAVSFICPFYWVCYSPSDSFKPVASCSRQLSCGELHDSQRALITIKITKEILGVSWHCARCIPTPCPLPFPPSPKQNGAGGRVRSVGWIAVQGVVQPSPSSTCPATALQHLLRGREQAQMSCNQKYSSFVLTCTPASPLHQEWATDCPKLEATGRHDLSTSPIVQLTVFSIARLCTRTHVQCRTELPGEASFPEVRNQGVHKRGSPWDFVGHPFPKSAQWPSVHFVKPCLG